MNDTCLSPDSLLQLSESFIDTIWGKIPIVAMTANAFAEDVQMALDAGMNQHMPKPIDMKQLVSVLTKWLS